MATNYVSDDTREVKKKGFSAAGAIALGAVLLLNVIIFIGFTNQWNERHPVATTVICTLDMAIAGAALVRFYVLANWKFVSWCALVGLVEGLLIGFAV